MRATRDEDTQHERLVQRPPAVSGRAYSSLQCLGRLRTCSLTTGTTIGPWFRKRRPRNNTHRVRNPGTHLGTLRKRFPAAYLGQL